MSAQTERSKPQQEERNAGSEGERLATIKLAFSRAQSETRATMAVEAREQAELRRLKRELEIVRQERDILKKAIQVFSRGES